jgi:hypothetical protein
MQEAIVTWIRLGFTAMSQLERCIDENGTLDKRVFHPVLSALNLNNILCWHWKTQPDGSLEKHFYLTFAAQRQVQ